MSSPLDPVDLSDILDPFAEPPAELPAPEPPPVETWPASPTRARTTATRAAAVVAALAFEALVLWKLGLRDGPTFDVALISLGTVVPAIAAVWALAAVQKPLARKGRVVAAIVVAIVAFVGTAQLTQGSGEASLAAIARCVVVASVLGAAPTLFAILAMRRAFVSGAAIRTAAIGAGAGLVGAAVLRLHCPNDALVHVLAGHGLPILLAAGLAMALGKRLTRA